MAEKDTDRDLQCTAVVQITLEIPCRQPWPPGTTAEEIFKDARREALTKIERLAPHYRMVGEPDVSLVMARRGALT